MARKERNIYKRKDGRYEGRYIKGRDAQGKAKYGAVYARSYAEVREKLQEVKLANANQLEFLSGKQRKVVAEVETYLESIKTQIKQSTYDCYRRYLDNHIAPTFKGIRCNQLTQQLLQGFINKQYESGLSAVTVQSVFIFLKKGLENAACGNIFGVKLPKRVTYEAEVFSIYEQKRLEAAAMESDSINCIGIILCLYTGVRIGELCGLLWSDLDFERRLLHIRRTSQRVSNPSGKTKTMVAYLSPKSESSRRSIPIPDFLLALLIKHKEQSTGDFIISRDGKAIEPRNMQYRFKRLLEVADLRPVNYHTTRHTFSVRALENGFDIKTLSEILGHSSPVITLTKYAHVLDEHKRRSMESLISVFER